MDLYEHQARDLFAEYGIAVPEAETVEFARRPHSRRNGSAAGSSSRHR